MSLIFEGEYKNDKKIRKGKEFYKNYYHYKNEYY